ncbi:MAG: NAD(P)/FAD-dependent oxidoreductase [Flavobacteriales bacterium]|nr:NAD(P)/FAD-dependent oxidoreductase [Flavobacteriales bacterium]
MGADEHNIPTIDLPRVVIIGGGFAGLKLAKGIDSRLYQTVLIDKNNYHTFQPLMYQVASSGLEPDSIAYPLRKIFKGKEHFHFRMADVSKVDVESKVVETSIGPIHYDKLVVATGADSNFFGMENVEKHSMPMKNLVESLNLRSRILKCFEKALNATDIAEQEALMSFVIVGGGPTGVELAGALAELKKQILPTDYPDLDIRRMQVHVVEAADRLLANMSDHASTATLKFLKSMGVNVWLGHQVKDFDGKEVVTDKHTFRSHTLIWAAGVKGMPIGGLDASLTRGNRLETNAQHEVKGMSDIYAVGDVSAVKSETTPNGYPMLASVAGQQGAHLAKNLNALAKGRKTTDFKFNDKGTMATIGRNRAVVDLPNAKFSGLFAWFTWMFVHLMLLVDFRSRLVVFINWAWSYINFDKGTRLIVRSEDD